MSTTDLAVALAPLLSQDEFRTAFAIQWVAQSYGSYGAEAMAPETFEETFDHIGSALAFGVRRMAEGGHRFPALRVDPDTGELYPVRGAAATPGNVLYINQLAVGRPINFLLAVQVALDFIENNGLDIDLEPLREAQAEIRAALEETRKEMPPEYAAELAENKRREMRIGRSISHGGYRNVQRKPIDC